MKVICTVDCGNAPRKEVLRDFNVDLVSGVPSALDLLQEDVVWEMVGGQRLVGPGAVADALAEMIGPEPQELHIHYIITHGTTAALNATLTRADGSKLAYCDVYLFTGGARTARIKQVTSYRLPLG